MVQNKPNSRKFVMNLLIKMEKNSAYSNLLLDNALQNSGLSVQDKKFASALFYGVIERLLTLDAVIDFYSNKPSYTLNIEVRQILRIGIYQLLYMDSVPESAAVNESVLLAKKNKNPSVSGFVNAVLRSFLRDNLQIPLGKNKLETLSLKFSCPCDLVKKWIGEYGEKTAIVMLETSLGRPPLTIRVNTIKTSCDEILADFEEEEIIAEKSIYAENAFNILSGNAVLSTKACKNGLFHVQDLSSQLTCLALSPKSGEVVLDICSAPGGKTFTLAEIMQNKGEIYAFDLHEKRVHLVRQGAKNLGIDIVKGRKNDGKIYSQDIPMADKILCDVPCSGLGVIRRKPEIKYKNLADFENLPQIQLDILRTSAKYLKVGGELVYSTCTLSKAENDEVIDKFLAENENFVGVEIFSDKGEPFGSYKATITPEFFNSDGFFMAKIKKIK